jgi:membrane fusion protein (multidrug efflux system)
MLNIRPSASKSPSALFAPLGRLMLGFALAAPLGLPLAFAFSAAPVAAQSGRSAVSAAAVEAEPVESGRIVEDIRAVGTLQPNESVGIATEIAGRVSNIHFREGERVKAGDTLIELDATILKAELDKASSDFQLAQTNQERAQTLASVGSGTQRARDETSAALRAAQANLALADARFQKATLIAPLSGIIGLRTISAGAYVIPGQKIVDLVDLDTLKLDFRVSEIHASRVRVGQSIVVSSDSAPNVTFEGSIYAIDPSVDVNGRAIRLRARVPNTNSALAPGSFARIRVVIEERPDALIVPESSIFPSGGKTLVYRLVNGRSVQSEVVLGLRLPGKVEIRKGLSKGDMIITSGQQRLRDGVAVQVVPTAAGASK